MSAAREQLLEASQRVRAFHEHQQAEYIIEDHDDPDQKRLTEDLLLVVNGLRELLAELDAKCRWTYDDCHSKHDTSCGTAFYIDSDYPPPLEAGFKFCPHCGKEIVSE